MGTDTATLVREHHAPLIEVGRDVRWETGGIRWLLDGRAAAGQEHTVLGRRGQ
jgi:hypothetical protein